MLRPVVRPRTTFTWAFAALALAALPATAAAAPEVLSLAAGSDPVAGQPSGIDYEYDTAGAQMNITIIARPSSGPACAATAGIDAATVGASGGSLYVTSSPIPAGGHGLARQPFTFPAPGSYRLCGWLARTPDDVAAVGVAAADVRLPRATVAVTPQELAPRAGGATIAVRAIGTVEGSADLYVTAVAGAAACPVTYDDVTDPLAFDATPAGTASRVTGDFDLSFQSHDLLAFRAWRVCAYLQDGTTATTAAATGSALLDLVLKPAVLSRPRVRQTGGAMTCDGGRWKSRPAARLSYAWLAGTRPLPGANGRRLAVTPALRGTPVRCRVTAKNRIGVTTATSKPVSAR